jgi:hypothetical protein
MEAAMGCDVMLGTGTVLPQNLTTLINVSMLIYIV